MELVDVIGGYIVRKLEDDNHTTAIKYAQDHPELDTDKIAEVIIADYLYHYHRIPWEILGRVMWIA